jgi:tRNA(Ile)-lysidine synthase
MTVWAEVFPAGEFPDFRNAGHQTAFFDMDVVSFPLIVRNAAPGDRFTPLGMVGSKRLKRFFMDQKIPASQRFFCPVLISHDKPVWVMGHRIDDSAKITANTRKVLKVRFSLA